MKPRVLGSHREPPALPDRMPPPHVHNWSAVDAGHPQRRTVQIWGCIGCTQVMCTAIGDDPNAITLRSAG